LARKAAVAFAAASLPLSSAAGAASRLPAANMSSHARSHGAKAIVGVLMAGILAVLVAQDRATGTSDDTLVSLAFCQGPRPEQRRAPSSSRLRARSKVLGDDFDVGTARARLEEAFEAEAPVPSSRAEQMDFEDWYLLALLAGQLASLACAAFSLVSLPFGHHSEPREMQTVLGFWLTSRACGRSLRDRLPLRIQRTTYPGGR